MRTAAAAWDVRGEGGRERVGVKEVYRGMQAMREESGALRQKRVFLSRYAFARLQRMRQLTGSIERELSALELSKNVKEGGTRRVAGPGQTRPRTAPAAAPHAGRAWGRDTRGSSFGGASSGPSRGGAGEVRVVRGPEAAREAAAGLKVLTEETVEELVSFTHYIKQMGGELEKEVDLAERELEALYAELGIDVLRRKPRR